MKQWCFVDEEEKIAPIFKHSLIILHSNIISTCVVKKRKKKKVKEIAQLRYCGQFISPYQAHLQRACEKYKTIMALEKMK